MSYNQPNETELLKAVQNGRRARPNLDSPYIAPKLGLETALATIWSEVLRLKAVGVDDNTFALGADSLDILRVANRIQSTLGIELELAMFFEAPTVRRLASKIAGRPGSGSTATV